MAQTKRAGDIKAPQVVPWALGNFIQVQGPLGVILHTTHMMSRALLWIPDCKLNLKVLLETVFF